VENFANEAQGHETIVERLREEKVALVLMRRVAVMSLRLPARCRRQGLQ
jgi:hypothetical protein